MFKQILIPVDLTHEEQMPGLFKIAQALAGNESATVHLLYVDQSLIHQSSYPFLDDSLFIEHKKAAEERMAKLMTALPNNLNGICHSANGIAHDVILESVDKLDIDAIVIAARRPGIRNYFISTTSERVVRHANCSVFVAREFDK